jgi:hypothetical protein
MSSKCTETPRSSTPLASIDSTFVPTPP